ncbi:7539_t:CDS:2, partial [Dentiscutata heterogama]
KRPRNKIAAVAIITTATTTAMTAATITAMTTAMIAATIMTTTTATKEEAEKQEEPQKEVVGNSNKDIGSATAPTRKILGAAESKKEKQERKKNREQQRMTAEKGVHLPSPNDKISETDDELADDKRRKRIQYSLDDNRNNHVVKVIKKGWWSKKLKQILLLCKDTSLVQNYNKLKWNRWETDIDDNLTPPARASS